MSGLFVHFHAIPLIMVPFSQVLRYLYHQFSLFYEMKLANKKKKVSYLDGVKKRPFQPFSRQNGTDSICRGGNGLWP